MSTDLTQEEKVANAARCIEEAGGSDLTPEQVVQMAERIDKAFKKISHDLVGLLTMEAELVLGGMLAMCLEAETDDPKARKKLALECIKQGRDYIASSIDVAAWKAVVRSHGTPIDETTDLDALGAHIQEQYRARHNHGPLGPHETASE